MSGDTFRTEQERFWAGDFGDAYSSRNVGAKWVASNAALFSQAIRRMPKVESVLELGANVGLNLMALRQLLPEARLSAVEINETAASRLDELGYVRVHRGSLLSHVAEAPHDLVIIKGVLIHISPDALSQAYDVLYRSSKRFIWVGEYYNPSPVALPYRGEKDKLFKRDFAGELLDRFSDLRLVDYGFAYHRDAAFPQDDITWFLLEKAG